MAIMNDQIICPNCKQSIPLTEALSHQIQDKYQKFYKIRLAEEKSKIEAALKEELTAKISSDLQLQIKDKANEAEELRKQNKNLQDQFLQLNQLIRQLKNENKQKQLEMDKELTAREDKIRTEEKDKIADEFKLKIAEKDKKLGDALKMADEYKRKLEQGSQQLQGEVLELELENILKREFPYDEINPVGKGIKGADVIQTVKNKYGQVCGSIIWESKRTKAWAGDWIVKLKEDQRIAKAEIAVIISQVLPEGIRHFGQLNGVWVGIYDTILGLSYALRSSLLEIAAVKNSNVNRQNKMEILYNYLSGIEFKQRLEAVMEAYTGIQEDIEREKRFFSAKWAKEEKNIRKVFDNLLGMYGDLQSMLGKTLGEIKGLSLLPEKEDVPVQDKMFQ